MNFAPEWACPSSPESHDQPEDVLDDECCHGYINIPTQHPRKSADMDLLLGILMERGVLKTDMFEKKFPRKKFKHFGRKISE